MSFLKIFRFQPGKVRFPATRALSSRSLTTKDGIQYSEHKLKHSTIRQLPAFHDNYIYLINNHPTNEIIVVDAGDAIPVINAIHSWSTEAQDDIQWNQFHYIFNTHHHNDHTGGNIDLKKFAKTEFNINCKIIGYEKQKDRLPMVDILYADGDEIFDQYQIFECGGHTIDHCAYFDYKNNCIFIGDTLFVMGCGKLFEGTAKQMYESMLKIIDLCNEETVVFCAHEYTLNNARFAMSMEPNNIHLQERFLEVKEMRDKNEWTVPSVFGEELKTNPFLRWHSSEIRENLKNKGYKVNENTANEEVFAALRSAKDSFK